MSRVICFLKVLNSLFFWQLDADENAEQTIVSLTLSNAGYFGGLKHCEAPLGKTVSKNLRLSTLSVHLQYMCIDTGATKRLNDGAHLRH